VSQPTIDDNCIANVPWEAAHDDAVRTLCVHLGANQPKNVGSRQLDVEGSVSIDINVHCAGALGKRPSVFPPTRLRATNHENQRWRA
jgi:hypothetical protein